MWFPSKVTIPLLSAFKAQRPDHPAKGENFKIWFPAKDSNLLLSDFRGRRPDLPVNWEYSTRPPHLQWIIVFGTGREICTRMSPHVKRVLPHQATPACKTKRGPELSLRASRYSDLWGLNSPCHQNQTRKRRRTDSGSRSFVVLAGYFSWSFSYPKPIKLECQQQNGGPCRNRTDLLR